MSDTLQTGVTWIDFVNVATVVVIVYLLTKLLQRRLARGLYLHEADGPVRAFVRIFALCLSPLSFLVLTALFVAVWPVVHGLVVLLVLGFARHDVRDYVAGRVLRFDRAVVEGRQLRSGSLNATISKFGLTALYLQRDDGRTRIGYRHLLRDGYTVAADPSQGGYFQLQVALHAVDSEPDAKKNYTVAERRERTARQLHRLLIDNPYVMSGFRIERHPADDEELVVDLDVGVHRAEHLRHLVAQLNEAGFGASVLSR